MKRKLKLGLLGNGIGKTQSKKLHELIGKLYDLDASYELMDLANKENANIEEELKRCKKEGFDGVNVTHPYKVNAFKCVKTMEGFPKGLTSVNTVLFKDELIADNTDYLGFCEAYRKKFNEQKPGKVLMLGAGGVGLAIAYGLCSLNVEELIVHDMNEQLATSLVEDLKSAGFNARLIKSSVEEEMKSVDGLINATPIGMFQYPGNPYPKEGFGGQKWAFDAVYTPVNTQFLQTCEENNIITISGFKLFLYQGIEAFKRFSGIDIDSDKIEEEFLKEYPLEK
ncbi:shikimate dehydrogenase family protein [Campylobacterota bacterium DY0563]